VVVVTPLPTYPPPSATPTSSGAVRVSLVDDAAAHMLRSDIELAGGLLAFLGAIVAALSFRRRRVGE
jgi:hypothetical protein